jgi:FSR family fosmidomycin resistance protein-like MFS transporter
MSSFRRYVLYLSSGHFLIHVYTHVIPALIPTFRNELGISLVQSGYLLSIPLIVNVIAYVPIGIISDRYGSKVLSACFIVTALGACLVAFSNSIWVLGLGAGLLGLGSTLYHPPSLKSASLVDSKRMNLTMSFYLAGGTSGIALGPISVGLLMPLIGWRNTILLWFPFQLLLGYWSHVFVKDTIVDERESKSVFQGLKSVLTPIYLIVIAAGSFVEITIVNLSGFITTYFNIGLGLSENISSLVFGLGPLAGIIGAFAGGKLGDKFGNTKALLGIIGLIIVLLATMPFITSVIFAISIYIIYRSIVSACMPLLNNLVAVNSDEQHRSLAFSFYFMISNIGAAVMPVITSLLVEKRGVSSLFPLSVILLLPALVLIYIIGRKMRKE